MRTLEELLTYVMPWAPGCPEPTAIHHLRQAAIEFCTKMRLWRGDDEFQVTPASCDVVCAPADAQVLDYERVVFNGDELEPRSLAQLDREYPRWRTDEASTRSSYYTQIDIGTIRIVPASTGTLNVYTILIPSEDGDCVPDWMFDRRYPQTIAAGALKDILMLPGQPFFSPEMAAGFASRFTTAMDTDGSLSSRGQQRARIRTRAQFF